MSDDDGMGGDESGDPNAMGLAVHDESDDDGGDGEGVTSFYGNGSDALAADGAADGEDETKDISQVWICRVAICRRLIF